MRKADLMFYNSEDLARHYSYCVDACKICTVDSSTGWYFLHFKKVTCQRVGIGQYLVLTSITHSLILICFDALTNVNFLKPWEMEHFLPWIEANAPFSQRLSKSFNFNLSVFLLCLLDVSIIVDIYNFESIIVNQYTCFSHDNKYVQSVFYKIHKIDVDEVEFSFLILV